MCYTSKSQHLGVLKMKIFSFLTQKKTKKTQEQRGVVMSDAYQVSLNKMGKEQFVSLMNRGLRVPIALL